MDQSLARIIASAIHHRRTQDQAGHPEGLSPGEWDAILLQIEKGFWGYVDEDGYPFMSLATSEKFERAFELFAEYFTALWD
jgi:hypothetical protein